MADIPEPLASIPFYPIRYDKPSPIHVFGSQRQWPCNVHIKREDQSSPAVCCGNKYRKLEYVIPDLQRATPAVTTIVTEGGLQSNHAAQTAGVAAMLGMECVLLLDEKAGGLSTAASPEAFRSAGNQQIYKLLGADIRVGRGPQDKGTVLRQLTADGKVPYFIPSGASTHPLGGLGYARCAFEIVAQEKEMSLPGTGRYDYIFVACGSGSTIGGLAAGFRLHGKLASQANSQSKLPERQLVGVMVMDKPGFEKQVEVIARTAAAKVGLSGDHMHIHNVRLVGDFVHPGYGVFDEKIEGTVQRFLREDQVLLDPVYSGKAARSMSEWIDSGLLAEDSRQHGHQEISKVNVLFIHTGGQTVLSAYAKA
ncbi:uncharacterized protein E0L32_008911 [Thyridium curvatum]|uniref:Tryptophan synthase beta chain-like PALP domain-containing protein n=1 Tax=Thyridium curvatum TaxID=1093900 RepID=A0A507AY04_9PEZI|nr:uncharacterized protein E0L32_008911 [Thyridium curvatum]TPX09889.1 hypothetical protein E0L32_008911 [Thyridium curvatum]